MPLVNAKCTNCGGTLQVDAAKEAAVCPFCGSAFIVEKAVQNYNIVNNIHADVVNIYAEKDFVIRSGILTQYKGESVDVVIPDNVLEIGANVFANNKYLSSVTLPASLRKIGSKAFYHCDSLTHIALPAGLRSIGNFAFSSCNALTVLTLPSSVQEVGDGAFCNCTHLAEVTLEEGASVIGMFAFYNCSALHKVTLPKTLKDISCAAFCNCPKLTDIRYGGSLNELIVLCRDSYYDTEEKEDSERLADIFYECCSNQEDYRRSEYDAFGKEHNFDEEDFDTESFAYDASLAVPPLKNLYLEGKLVQGRIEIPDEYAKNSAFFLYFTLLKGYDKIDTVVLPHNFNIRKNLIFCPVCGGRKSISLFGKCKKCGTTFLRKKQ